MSDGGMTCIIEGCPLEKRSPGAQAPTGACVSPKREEIDGKRSPRVDKSQTRSLSKGLIHKAQVEGILLSSVQKGPRRPGTRQDMLL